MSYKEIILDDSILDIDSWLPKDVFAEIAAVVFDKQKPIISNFNLLVSYNANYIKQEDDKHKKKNFEGSEYTTIDSKVQSYENLYPYEGAA